MTIGTYAISSASHQSCGGGINERTSAKKSWLVVEVRPGGRRARPASGTDGPDQTSLSPLLPPSFVPPSPCRRSFHQNLALPPSRPSRTFHPGRRAPRHPRSVPAPGVLPDPVGSRAREAARVGDTPRPAQGQEMGQAFRKLFDAFFGNKEMRVCCLLSLCLVPPRLSRTLQ